MLLHMLAWWILQNEDMFFFKAIAARIVQLAQCRSAYHHLVLQVGFFRDWIAPAVIATLVMTFLIVLLLVSAVQIWIHHTS